jgi:hypothetical protein
VETKSANYPQVAGRFLPRVVTPRAIVRALSALASSSTLRDLLALPSFGHREIVQKWLADGIYRIERLGEILDLINRNGRARRYRDRQRNSKNGPEACGTHAIIVCRELRQWAHFSLAEVHSGVLDWLEKTLLLALKGV